MLIKTATRAVPALLALMAICQLSFGHAAPQNAGVVAALQQQPLSDAPGKSGVMITVSYAPGGATMPHLHPGSIFAYVLEGEVTSQLQGQAPVTYKAGESWYEAPGTPHLISKNASASKPAKLLVWSLVQDGKQLTVPFNQ